MKKKGDTLPKFFIDKSAIKGGTCVILGGDAAHISKVLRLSIGDEVVLCDGEGTDYDAKISSVGKSEVGFSILNEYPCESEPKVFVTLFQGIPKASKMEYIIQKCTELGIANIVPVMTKRTVVKLENAQVEQKKLERWNKIAQEAVKQCGRGRVPTVDAVCDIKDIKNMISDFDLFLVAYEDEENISLKSVLKNAGAVNKIGIVIGPEGGFEKAEVEMLISAGAKSVSLGKRILRTETAGHTVLTAVLYELGELE